MNPNYFQITLVKLFRSSLQKLFTTVITMSTTSDEVIGILNDVIAALPDKVAGITLLEAFTETYIRVARNRYPKKNVFVFDRDAIIGVDFDDFKETIKLNAGDGKTVQYNCFIFANGTVEYQGSKEAARLGFGGSWKQKDNIHIEFFDIIW
ncbi:hypothetical protein EJ08DRAFT_676807 [Tothia fuscella]|uniref:Uncharacterized protein n=1 Tax=Tothia fuscella TaxID=1048955 RepID=A0A9P4NX69_9PEZI|nr:hypothetical protein EJ08DRAFT_676807 [Tothia fuscella]